jgi:hypothetical protein
MVSTPVTSRRWVKQDPRGSRSESRPSLRRQISCRVVDCSKHVLDLRFDLPLRGLAPVNDRDRLVRRQTSRTIFSPLAAPPRNVSN